MRARHLSTVAVAALLVLSGIGAAAVAADTGGTERTNTEQSAVPTDADRSGVPTDAERPGPIASPGVGPSPAVGAAAGAWPGTDTADRLADFLAEFDLSPETEAAIRAELTAMLEDGASRQDVHHAAHYLLYQEGYDTPAVHTQFGAFVLSERFDVDDADAEAVVTTAREMRADGATPAEIREYVRGALAELGVDIEDLRPRGGGGPGGFGGGGAPLTDGR